MTVGSAGSGFFTVDIKYPSHSVVRKVAEELGLIVPPAYLLRPRIKGWGRWCGTVLGVPLEDYEWRSYGVKFEQHDLIGVAAIGMVNCYVGIESDATVPYLKELEWLAFDKFVYDIRPRFSKLVKDNVEDELYGIHTIAYVSRPIDLDCLENVEKVLLSMGYVPWGKQLCKHFRRVHPEVKGIGGNLRPRGPIVLSSGWRMWALTPPPAKYSAKWKTCDPVMYDNVKDVVEEILDKFEDFLVWKKVWWGGEWIGED